MAIDDNTVYGLTGAQVKELPGKIAAVKGLARDLTEADYDWPVDNPIRVALWKLPSGIYTHSQANIAISKGDNVEYNQYLIFVDSTDQNNTDILLFNHNETLLVDKVRKSDGFSYGRRTFLESTDVVNNLTSTSTNTPLSAAQGKVLKDLIDAIQVPTKTSDLTNDSSFVTSTEMTTALADKADANDIPTTLSELTNDINAVSDANYVHTDNNYTTVEKSKLAGITAGAEANTIDTVEVNGTALAPDANKAVDISVPTAVSELTNDSGFTSNVGTITGVSANGTSVATAGVANIPSATTSRYGVTQLSTSTSSTSTTLAATPSAVRTAYNLANGKATITMSTTDPGEGSALAANNFIAVYGDDPMSYSTSEVDTGSTWVNGAPIYKKTFNFGTLPNATSKTVAHGISSLAQVVKIEAVAHSTNTGRFIMMPLVYNSNDTTYNTEISVTATNIEARSAMDRSGYTAYVTLYYTKSS